MTLTEFETLLKSENFAEVATVTRDGSYVLGDHAHPFDACALITQGDITLVVAGVATTYLSGDIFRLPAHTPHEESAGANGVQYRVGRRSVAA